MDRSRLRRVTALFACAYAVVVVVVVWSPEPLTGPLAPLLDRADLLLQRLGAPVGLAFKAFDFGANVLMFIPPALLLALWMRRENWQIVVLLGFAATLTIEMVQLQFLSDRSATISDVVANTLGAYLGVLLSFGLRSRLWGRRSPAPSRTDSSRRPSRR